MFRTFEYVQLNHETKMVTYFNKKDLVKFGKYLLSDKRKARILEAKNEDLTTFGPDDSEKLCTVYHADIENWLEEQEKED